LTSTAALDAPVAWSILKNATSNGYLIGVDCMNSNSAEVIAWGLPCGHAYSAIATYTAKNKTNGADVNLIQVRNPWGYDGYHGPWGDASTMWNTIDWKTAGIPYVNNTKDGDFFVQDTDFPKLYSTIEVAAYSKSS